MTLRSLIVFTLDALIRLVTLDAYRLPARWLA